MIYIKIQINVNPTCPDVGETMGISEARTMELVNIATKIGRHEEDTEEITRHSKTDDFQKLFDTAKPENINEVIFLTYAYTAYITMHVKSQDETQRLARIDQLIKRLGETHEQQNQTGIRLIRG